MPSKRARGAAKAARRLHFHDHGAKLRAPAAALALSDG